MKWIGKAFSITTLVISALIITVCATLGGEELFVAEPLPVSLAPLSFKDGIGYSVGEGLACDAEGNVYVTNFEKRGTIGKVSTDGTASVYVELPEGSIGSRIAIDKNGFMYVADYVNSNILQVDPETRSVTVFAHFDRNEESEQYWIVDLAMAPDGTIYASDTGDEAGNRYMWRIDHNGKKTVIGHGPKAGFDGSDISPDGKTLFFLGSMTMMAYTITDSGDLTGFQVVTELAFGRTGGHTTDLVDIACDVDGNLYITQSGDTVIKISPTGEIIDKYDIIESPGAICFGGPDGRTAYMIDIKSKYMQKLVKFRVDRPGAAWQRLQP